MLGVEIDSLRYDYLVTPDERATRTRRCATLGEGKAGRHRRAPFGHLHVEPPGGAAREQVRRERVLAHVRGEADRSAATCRSRSAAATRSDDPR
jgi:hypothetical protein